MRAQYILEDLQAHSADVMHGAIKLPADKDYNQMRQTIAQLQLDLELTRKKLAALQQIDYDHLSPKAAFDLLWQLKEL